MDVNLSNTSSIFQLAIGVNAVFAVLLNQYLNHKKRIVHLFINKIKDHKPNFSPTGKEKHIADYTFHSMPGFRLFKRFFILCSVMSSSSVLISFYCLLLGAFNTNYIITSGWLIFLSMLTIIINPIIYFIFFKLSEAILFALEVKFTLPAEYIPLIEQYLDNIDFIENSRIKLDDFKERRLNRQRERNRNKRLKTYNIMRHPINYALRKLDERKLEKLIQGMKKKGEL
jgi:hypothetical protein